MEDYTLVVNGEAVKSVVPDKVLMSLTVQAEAPKQKDAVDKQKRKATQLLDILREVEIPDKDISTAGYSYNAVYDHSTARRFKGFQVVQNFTIKTNPEKAGELVDKISAIAEVNGINFIVSNEKELKEELVGLAINNAKEKAKKRAGQLGIKLGKIVNFQESGQGNRPRGGRMMVAAAGAGMREDSGAELPAGETELNVVVSLTYQIDTA